MGRLTQWLTGPHPYRALWSRLHRDARGQDLIEYALLAAFVAVAAGAILPGPSASISTVFSKVSSVLGATPS
jgi:pilus assembly protein Flp/PilA